MCKELEVNRVVNPKRIFLNGGLRRRGGTRSS
jgi:hypothetical protein